MTTRRKHYTGTQQEFEVGMSGAKAVLPRVEAALATEKSTPAMDSFDAKARDQNISRLSALVERLKSNIAAFDARIADMEQGKADAVAMSAAKTKADIMADLRRGFAGDDADWERLQDQLYDRFLLDQGDTFASDVEAARKSGRYIA